MNKTRIFNIVLALFVITAAILAFASCNGSNESFTNGSVECSHSYDSGEITASATCMSDGEKLYTCTKCGHTKKEIISKTGHNFSPGVVTQETTCVQDGVIMFACNNCGEIKTQTTEKKGHRFDSGKITQEATCIQHGIKTFTCYECGETKTEDIEKTTHEFDSGVVTQEATCLNDGVKTFTCKICGETKTGTINKTKHNFDSGVVTQEATCLSDGVKTFTCKYCGETKTGTINKTKHNFDSGVVTQEATCFNDGVKTFTCDYCGYVKTQSITKTEHQYENNKCIYCQQTTEGYVYGLGETWVVEGQWEFTVDMVATHDECKANSIIITYTYKNIGYEDDDEDGLKMSPNRVYLVSGGQIVYMKTYADYPSYQDEHDDIAQSCVIGGEYTRNAVYYADKSYDIDEIRIEMHEIKANGTLSDYAKATYTVPVHTHEYDSGVVTTQASPSAPGEKTYTCQTCGWMKTEEIPYIYGIGETWTVNGQFEFTIDNVVDHYICGDYRKDYYNANFDQCIIVHYTYKNLGCTEKLEISARQDNFEVYDENLEGGSSYIQCDSYSCGLSIDAVGVLNGGSHTAAQAFVLRNTSNKVTIYVDICGYREMFEISIGNSSSGDSSSGSTTNTDCYLDTSIPKVESVLSYVTCTDVKTGASDVGYNISYVYSSNMSRTKYDSYRSHLVSLGGVLDSDNSFDYPNLDIAGYWYTLNGAYVFLMWDGSTNTMQVQFMDLDYLPI